MSTASSPKIAAQRLIQALRSAIGCVTTWHIRFRSTSFDAGQEYDVYLSPPVPLRSPSGGPSGLLFDMRLVFEVTVDGEHAGDHPAWRMRERMYEYRLLDHDQTELLVYHWQPGPAYQGPDQPHLHVSAALDARIDAMTRREIDLDRLHLLTGQVSLAGIIRMLMTEFGIASQRHDWRDTLDHAESALRTTLDQ